MPDDLSHIEALESQSGAWQLEAMELRAALATAKGERDAAVAALNLADDVIEWYTRGDRPERLDAALRHYNDARATLEAPMPSDPTPKHEHAWKLGGVVNVHAKKTLVYCLNCCTAKFVTGAQWDEMRGQRAESEAPHA